MTVQLLERLNRNERVGLALMGAGLVAIAIGVLLARAGY